jgi:hypothetical protein
MLAQIVLIFLILGEKYFHGLVAGSKALKKFWIYGVQ